MTTDTEQSNDLGTRFAGQRGRMGLSQEDLAAKAGMSTSYISCIERGHRTPRWEKLTTLARALDTTPEWLMTGKALADLNDELGGLRMCIAARRLTRRDVERVEAMIRIMFPLEDE